MNRSICVTAFVVGLVAVVWVGVGYVGSSALALAMTALIGAVYVTGAAEMRRFHRDTAGLARALRNIPEALSHPGEWLDQVPASLRNAVRLRIEGERAGLPGPALTPYLVGLLVLLGMMGTFLGMVVTLNGAVIALESTTDLQTIRAALAAPVKGLGVAFGTSVAGVAASAMLGLISALCRRARQHTAQMLDGKIATTLRGFSLAHQRRETFTALQAQARALPAVVEKLEAMMAQMERHSVQRDERLLAEQDRFYRDARGMYADLAASVGASLKESLTESARLAGETIRPAVADTMAGIARETAALQEQVADAVKAQLEGISARFDGSTAAVVQTWASALAAHERTSDALARQLQGALAAYAETFEQRSAALLVTMEERAAAMHAEATAADEARQAGFAQALTSMAASLQREWQQAGVAALARHERICATLGETARDITTAAEAQASRTIDEVARLMHAAAEAPRAAAEVIGELRQELSASIARDNTLLAERSRITETLGTLLAAIDHAATGQRQAIDALVASATAQMERAATRFTDGVEAESARMAEVAGQVSGGAVEVASLAEAFALGVRLFSESNDKLAATLQRIEGALDKSMTRSDEQLAYYVAQAREIIDLSIMSQRQVVEDLLQLPGRESALAGEA